MFLVYDEASCFVLACSILQPAENNWRVTWDPNLQGGHKLTAKKDISAQRGVPEGSLTTTPEEGTPTKGLTTPADSSSIQSSPPPAPAKPDRLNSQDEL